MSKIIVMSAFDSVVIFHFFGVRVRAMAPNTFLLRARWHLGNRCDRGG